MGPSNEVVSEEEIDLSEFEESEANVNELCVVGQIIEKLDDTRKEKLKLALSSPHPNYMNRWRIPTAKIRNTLRDWGYKTGEYSIGVHRRKGCGCPPTVY